MIPALLYLSAMYGAVGAAWAWAVFNAAFLLLWSPVVHHRFAPGLHARWLWSDIIQVAAVPCGLALLAINLGLAPSPTRSQAAARLALSFALMLVPALLTARRNHTR
jgi:hypothetical protein